MLQYMAAQVGERSGSEDDIRSLTYYLGKTGCVLWAS